MVFKNLCVLVLWTKVALALEGLMDLVLVYFDVVEEGVAAILFWTQGLSQQEVK